MAMTNPQLGAYQITPHGYQIKVLAPDVDANVFAVCGCANEYGRRCWCPHNRSTGLCPECVAGAPPHHFYWCPLYEKPLPPHVENAIREQEEKLTQYVREQTGRDDLTVEYDRSPLEPR